VEEEEGGREFSYLPNWAEIVGGKESTFQREGRKGKGVKKEEKKEKMNEHLPRRGDPNVQAHCRSKKPGVRKSPPQHRPNRAKIWGRDEDSGKGGKSL